MTTVTLHPGDNRESMRRLIAKGVRVHSVCTDPPYGLVSVQKRFSKTDAKAARSDKNDGSFARLSGGFMGKTWDGTGIERDPEFWALVFEILLPGGYVFAFSGSRTGHWQACAMEMAGFIMHPMHGWVFGSGFPKAHAADKAIDKMLGVTGGFVADGEPVKRMIPGADQHRDGSWTKDNGQSYQPGDYVPGSPEAAEWDGWAYGTQAQKPALEPIYLGQKPFSEKTGAANLLKHGVGAVNIDGCRVGLNGDYKSKPNGRPSHTGLPDGYNPAVANKSDDRGRHPANLILDGSPEVVAMFPTSSVTGTRSDTSKVAVVTGTKWLPDNHESKEYTDAGSAARFFHHFPPDMNPVFYQGKAGKTDRAPHLLPLDENGKPIGGHPTVKPIALMQYLIRHITPPGGTVLDPFAGSGTTGEAAKLEGFDCILMEAEPEYLEFLNKRFDLATPKPVYDFDDLLGEAVPASSTNCGSDFADLLG